MQHWRPRLDFYRLLFTAVPIGSFVFGNCFSFLAMSFVVFFYVIIISYIRLD